MNHPVLSERVRSGGPYSAAWRAGDFLFVSGQGPFDPLTGLTVGDTIEDQTRQTLTNILAVLEAGGASLTHVVKVTVLLADVTHFSRMNDVYRAFFHEPYPARTTSGAELARSDMLVEIDAIAYLGA